MIKSKNKITSLLLLVVMTFVMLFGSVCVNADYTEIDDHPLGTLKTTVATGSYTYITGGKQFDLTENRYKVSGGGYKFYTELFATGTSGTKYTTDGTNQLAAFVNGDALLNTTDVEKLTPGARQDFLGDMLMLAQSVVNDSENGYRVGSAAPTDDTMSDFMDLLQQQSGMGASLLATLMQNTNPDYSTANRIYEPFSGTVGTILGVVSIFIMALLGVTMALDIAYITIPAFQMALGGDESGQNGKKGLSGIISPEAKNAAKAAEGGGGQGGSGEYKAAVGIYFKYRWKGLVLLAICLLYLVQGEIYSLVGWFIDLFSGFLGV